MSMMMRVRVWRGGRRVVRWRRRLQHRSPTPPEKLMPAAPFATAAGWQARQLEEEVESSLPEISSKKRTRRLRRLARKLVDGAVWWWMRLRWRAQCPYWLMKFVLGEAHRCRTRWQRVRVRLLLRSVRRKRWYLEWRQAARARQDERPPNRPLHLTRSPIRWLVAAWCPTGALAGEGRR